MKRVGLSIALSLLAAPIYAHHVPGSSSAVVTVSIPGCANPACSVTVTTANGLNCREDANTRNVTCNLPAPFRIPATAISGQPQFDLSRTVAATDPAGNALGAEFIAICNAVLGGACDNTIQYKFQNSTIRKIAGSGFTTQRVQIDMGFTMGLLPDQSLNSTSTTDPTIGRAHGFSSKGTFVPAGTLVALGNTHSASASFTYVQSSGTCGSVSEPFATSGCTATMAIPCSTPATDSNKGVTCTSTGGSYEVKSSTLASWNAISVAGGLNLLDGVQRLCTNLFGNNKTCQAVERGTATLTYGLRRINDRVNITASGEGTSGLASSALTEQAAEGAKCSLHESNGGTTINPNDNGQFKVQFFGDSAIDTSTADLATTFLSLPGGALIQAKDIRYNLTLSDPETGIADEFFDAWVIYDSSDLQAAGITCQDLAGQSITLIQQSVADVTVSGSTVVAGFLPGRRQATSFGDFTTTTPAQVVCEIPAIVGPCNNP